MHPILGSDWQKTLWKLVSNPAIEVIAAIVVVLFMAWIVITTEAENRHTVFPVPTLSNK